MAWFYTREYGPEGEIITDEGVAPGASLSVLLEQGPMPHRAALEAIAALADILTIAEEDGAIHGDLKPGDVFIDSSGSVSLMGYGENRAGGRAPEGASAGIQTDTYGLGIVLHAVLSNDSMGHVPRDRDGHDDAIVDRLMAIDWGEMVGMKWCDAVLHFLCSMLAFDPSERPAALDVANILSEVSVQIPGSELVEWARRAPMDASPVMVSPEEDPTEEEDLGGPQSLGRVFSQTGMYSRRQAASTKGECTAFWSRDKIEAMLDGGEDALADSPMAARRAEAVRPRVAPGRAAPSKPSGPPKDYPERIPWSPDSTFTGKPQDEAMSSALKNLRESFGDDAAEAAAQAIGSPQRAERSKAVVPKRPPAPPSPAAATAIRPGRADKGRTAPAPQRPPAKKPFPWLWVALGAVAMIFMMSLLTAGAVVYWVMNREEAPVAAPIDAEPTPAPEIEPEAEPEAEPEPAPRANSQRRSKKSRSARSSSTTRSRSSAPSRTTGRASSGTTSPRASADTVGVGDFTVRFQSMGVEARLSCGDGQSVSFVGTTRRSFKDVTTCRVAIEDAVGAVQLRRDSTVRCSKLGTTVTCVGA